MPFFHENVSIEAQVGDPINLSPRDKAIFCTDAYLAVYKARLFIHHIERILDLSSPENIPIYNNMIRIQSDMFKLLGTLQYLNNAFVKEEEG